MFENIYQGKKVLVTGHTGFKGSWICCWLLNLGAEVYGISKDIPTQPSMFTELGLEKKIKHHILDIRKGSEVIKLISSIKPDYIFHLAAQPIVSVSYKDPSQTFETNVLGTMHVLQGMLALENGVIGVMITSDKCYENVEWTWGYRENDRLGGKDPYSASKGAAEILIHSFYYSYFKDQTNKRIVSVRAGNVIGGGDWAPDRVVPDAVRAWAQDKAVTIRRPEATRPWQHVLEPLSGYLRTGQLLTSQSSMNGESYNFGPSGDQNFSVINLLEVMSKQWFVKGENSKIKVESAGSFHEAGLLKLNCDKAFHQLQWKPVLDFSKTTDFTTQWYSQFYRNGATDLFDFTIKQIESYKTMAKEKKLSWA